MSGFVHLNLTLKRKTSCRTLPVELLIETKNFHRRVESQKSSHGTTQRVLFQSLLHEFISILKVFTSLSYVAFIVSEKNNRT